MTFQRNVLYQKKKKLICILSPSECFYRNSKAIVWAKTVKSSFFWNRWTFLGRNPFFFFFFHCSLWWLVRSRCSPGLKPSFRLSSWDHNHKHKTTRPIIVHMRLLWPIRDLELNCIRCWNYFPKFQWSTIMGSMGVANNFKFIIYKSEDEPTGAIDLRNFKLVLEKLPPNECGYEFCSVFQWS